MLVTRETDYAIRTVVYLAKDGGRLANVTEVAEAMRIPKTFLAKIVQRLAKHGILESSRGVNGGFRLAIVPKEISLFSILEAIQGTAAINMCVAGRRTCGLSGTCAVHPVWVEMRREVEKRLKAQTIETLLAK
jgi:Rrf2 family protein